MKTIIREYELEEDINGELCIFGDLLNEYEIEDDLTLFAYDGCHKIYIIEDKEDREQAKEFGYSFYPISNLQCAYENSCELKFINNWKLDKTYVGQFENATFERSE